MTEKNSKFYVNRSIGEAGKMPPPEGEEGVIAVHRFEGEVAKVSVDYALTMNLGNYESARISVSVELPCYREEIDDAYEYAQAWVEERIAKERDMIASSRDGSGPL